MAAAAAVTAADKATTTARDRHWLSEERIRVYPLLLLVIFGCVTVWWVAQSLPGMVDPYGKPLGADFIAFWSAAKLALQGRPETAYDWTAIAAMHHVAVPALPADKLFLWHYPPAYLLVVLPLGLLPYAAALPVFLVATAGFWAALVRRILPDRRAWLAAAALPAGIVNLMHGQNGFLTAALAGFALLALDRRRPIVAGVLIGLLAVKPHLAVLFPVALIAARQWRAFWAAAVVAVGLTVASVAIFGWGTMSAFLHDIGTTQQFVDAGRLPWGKIPSLDVFALSLGAPASLAMASQIVIAVAAAGCVWMAWRAPAAASFEARAAVLIIGSLLVSPYVFSYDLTWEGLAIAWLVLLGLRDGFRRGEREILLLAWLSPLLMEPALALTRVQIGLPLLLALLVLAVSRSGTTAAAAARAVRHPVTPVPQDAAC